MIDAKISGTTHVIQLLWTNFEIPWIWKKMQGLEFMADSRCLKIAEKVLFNVASEARYFYKSSSKMPKLVKFVNFWWPCLEVKQCYQVNFNRKNSSEKCPNFKIQMRHFKYFSNNACLTFDSYFTLDKYHKKVPTSSWKLQPRTPQKRSR